MMRANGTLCAKITEPQYILFYFQNNMNNLSQIFIFIYSIMQQFRFQLCYGKKYTFALQMTFKIPYKCKMSKFDISTMYFMKAHIVHSILKLICLGMLNTYVFML